VVINKTEIRNNGCTVGIAAVNIVGSNSIISRVMIRIYCTMFPGDPMPINGIVVHYKEWVGQMPYSFKLQYFSIRQFLYKFHGSCLTPFINSTFSQKSYDAPKLVINNTIFGDLINSSALYYFMEICASNLSSAVVTAQQSEMLEILI